MTQKQEGLVAELRTWGIMLGQTDFDLVMSGPGPGHGLLGVYAETWNAPDRVDDPRPRTALYPTREAAREALRRLKIQRDWPRARVVPLRVTIEVAYGQKSEVITKALDGAEDTGRPGIEAEIAVLRRRITIDLSRARVAEMLRGCQEDGAFLRAQAEEAKRELSRLEALIA